MGKAKQIVEVDMAAVEGLLKQSRALLPSADYELLEGLVNALVKLTSLVRKRGTTIARLRRLVGLSTSEKTADVLGEGATPGGTSEPPGSGDSAADGDKSTAPARDVPGTSAKADRREKKKRKGHGRVPASAYPDAQHCSVSHESLRAGDVCPLCGRGKLYEFGEPAPFLRIVGQPPLVAVCWDCERLRCATCNHVFTARAPDEAQGDKHADTAVSMMALLRYGAGMPLNRLGQLQTHLQTPLPASTQWDVVNRRAQDVRPAYEELFRLAAQGLVVHNDDSYVRILEFMGTRRATLLSSGELPDPERTGLFTTAIVSIVDARRTIALFFTGRKHAGENLAELLDQRALDLPPPTQMSDALERNRPKGHETVEANCMAHGRRKVVDEIENFPEECRHLLETLGRVFKLDAQCQSQKLSDQERLLEHQRVSGPLLDELEKWMEAQVAEKKIEPNSGLGDAINYMLKRWDKLTLFLRVPGAPLENNICERALKMAIRHRNNSLFYRSQHGANVGDMFMTLIHTTQISGQNPFHYLTMLLGHAKAVAQTPGDWLPWNYQETLERLAKRDASGTDSDPPEQPGSFPELDVASAPLG